MILPNNCISIIKEFVIDLQKLEYFKNKIKIISKELTLCFPRFGNEIWVSYWAWDNKENELQAIFCTKCGNYKKSTCEYISEEALCLNNY